MLYNKEGADVNVPPFTDIIEDTAFTSAKINSADNIIDDNEHIRHLVGRASFTLFSMPFRFGL